jgi:hypothetical protein
VIGAGAAVEQKFLVDSDIGIWARICDIDAVHLLFCTIRGTLDNIKLLSRRSDIIK